MSLADEGSEDFDTWHERRTFEEVLHATEECNHISTTSRSTLPSLAILRMHGPADKSIAIFATQRLQDAFTLVPQNIFRSPVVVLDRLQYPWRRKLGASAIGPLVSNKPAPCTIPEQSWYAYFSKTV